MMYVQDGANWEQGLEGYFRDPGFYQNTLGESGKRN